jgi:hypothetical protein
MNEFEYKGKTVRQMYDSTTERYSYICDGKLLKTIRELEIHIQPSYLAQSNKKKPAKSGKKKQGMPDKGNPQEPFLRLVDRQK